MPEPPFEFDVFLSHNSKDKPTVELIAEFLEVEHKLKPWLDKWERIAGTVWMEMLEQGLKKSATVAVFLSEAGFGRWENEEMRAAISTLVSNQNIRVIPVLLPGSPADPDLPIFLKRYGWVDLREGYDEKQLDELVRGIKGIKLREREVASSQPQGSVQSAEHLRQLRAENVQPESNKGMESTQQSGRNLFRRNESANLKPPSTEELMVSRKQLQDLHHAQHTLQDFLDGYIKFGELWAECDKAKSKLWEQLENQTEDIFGLRYWDDLKELIIHAQSQVDGEVPEFVQEFPKSTNQFIQFNQALDGAMHLLETVQPKTAKSKKLEMINKAHEHMRTAVIMAEAIVKTCQEGAKDQLKEISVVMDTIFEAQSLPSPGTSNPPRESHRSIHRVQISENKVESTPRHVPLPDR